MARAVKEWTGKHDDQMPGQNVRLRIAARQGDKCPDCTRDLRSMTGNACDHIVPLADGGPNAESNLQILCRDCHGRKTGMENSRRAVERGLKAKALGLAKKETHPNFRRPKGSHYDWSRGGRLVRGDAR